MEEEWLPFNGYVKKETLTDYYLVPADKLDSIWQISKEYVKIEEGQIFVKIGGHIKQIENDD